MRRIVTSDRLRTLIRFERQVRPSGIGKAGQEKWERVAQVRAEVFDSLPSRSTEKLEDGMMMAARQSRITIRWRPDITSDLRIVIGALDQPDSPPPTGRRIMRIVGGPAELGRHDGLELMAQDTSTTGAGA